MIVAFDSFAAAAFAPASDVNVSKLPEMRIVGKLLATGWRIASGTAGIFQISRESNFRIDKGSCGYPALWNAFKRIADGCSAAEKAALFAGTATKFYRLG